ncbi:hypothetical protein [Streptomyces platensis]|uniref:hypothetical protein n=1 Tax=Streptomyces platensis TaxID=58346 RepID=UPI003316D3F1
MPKPMTAADHLRAGEELLAKAETYYNSEKLAGWGACAQAHFAAARLLLDADAMRHAPAALGRTGMDEVIDERSYQTLARTS